MVGLTLAAFGAGTSGDNPLMVLLGLPMAVAGVTAGYYGLARSLLPFLRERRARGEGERPRGRSSIESRRPLRPARD